MYKADTILKLKDPQDDVDGEPFAYNRVKVIGQSPISHASIEGEWSGTGAQGVIIQPLDGFGANTDEPYGKLVELYDIEAEPERKIAQRGGEIEVIDATAGDSPEDIFRRAPVEKVPEPKKPKSPLDSVRKGTSDVA